MAVKTKVSEIDTAYLANYLRLDAPDTAQTEELGTMLSSAKGYLSSYTGLPAVAPADDATTTTVDESDVTTLDSYPEFVTAVCVLVQNQYDNRTLYIDKGTVETILNSIIGLHRENLVG